MFKKSIFIFTRDIRKIDNLALEECSKKSKRIIPIFIVTPEQTDKNKYFSERAFNFLIQATKNEIPEMQYFKGKPDQIIKDLIGHVDAVFMSFEISPYGRKRAEKIAKVCSSNDVPFFEIENHYLYHPQIENTDDEYPFIIDKPYKVYGAFKNKCLEFKKVPKPSTYSVPKSKFIKVDGAVSSAIPKSEEHPQFPARRSIALARIRRYNAQKYSAGRDDPFADTTTRLSPYLSFGLISPREMPFKHGDTLHKELIWRDFFGQCSYHFPESIEGGRFRNAKKKWKNPKNIMRNIKNGNTGCPIVDFSLKQLYEDGWVHNRLRMIFATYIHEHDIDWKWGEKLYANNLIDYDINSNHWNWAHHSNQGTNFQFKIRKMKVETQAKKMNAKLQKYKNNAKQEE